MVAQDVGSDLTLVAFLREHHDHASARPHVLYIMLQVFVLVAERPNQRPLKLGKEPMLGARGIRAVEVLFPMEDVDVLPREPDLQQRLDGSLSVLRIDEAPQHSIRGIRDESVWLVHVAGHSGAIGGILHDLAAGRDIEKRAIAADTRINPLRALREE